MPEFCREVVEYMPYVSLENLCGAFRMLNSSHPFPEGVTIMRHIQSVPIANTNALYYEAKVKEFIAVLLDWYERLQSHTDNGIVSPEDQQAIGFVTRYIEDSFTRQLDVDHCVRIACMSKSKLSVIFKQVTGVTMSAYLTGIRIETAKRLLLAPGKTIQQISALVGYNNHSSFTAVFKMCTGYSPKEYRIADMNRD